MDLKYQPVASRFTTYSSRVNLDLRLDVPAAEEEEEAEKAFFQKVLAAGKQEVASFDKGVAFAVGPGQLGSVSTVAVDFFISMHPPDAPPEDSQPAVKRVRLTGTVSLVASVHEKEDEQAGIAVREGGGVRQDKAVGTAPLYGEPYRLDSAHTPYWLTPSCRAGWMILVTAGPERRPGEGPEGAGRAAAGGVCGREGGRRGGGGR